MWGCERVGGGGGHICHVTARLHLFGCRINQDAVGKGLQTFKSSTSLFHSKEDVCVLQTLSDQH